MCRSASTDQITYRSDFSGYGNVFSRWTFTSTDFEGVPLDPDDFIYADPPYNVEFTGTRRAASDGTTRSESLNGSQTIPALSC